MIYTILGVVFITLIYFVQLYTKAKTEKKIEKEILGKTNEILKEQRDNNVYSVDDADRVWDNWKQ